MATEFAISRFCVPLIHAEGWALFADCDIICMVNIEELFALAHDRYAVMVVKHQWQGGDNKKMDGQMQTFYARKNWSSVVLWNCEHPDNRALTWDVVNSWPGRELHAFRWLENNRIGELPPEWNYLVDVNPPMEKPKIVHYTLGGPWLPNWKPRDSDQPWLAEKHLAKVK